MKVHYKSHVKLRHEWLFWETEFGLRFGPIL